MSQVWPALLAPSRNSGLVPWLPGGVGRCLCSMRCPSTGLHSAQLCVCGLGLLKASSGLGMKSPGGPAAQVLPDQLMACKMPQVTEGQGCEVGVWDSLPFGYVFGENLESKAIAQGRSTFGVL